LSTIFRPYNSSSGQRSDRSAGDRLRHRQKVREAIRNNIADIIAEESIIGKDRNRIIKVPIRGVKEYRFIYGENAPGVGEGGDGEPKPGDVLGQGKDGKAGQQAGDRPGIDYYETDVSLDELVDLMFEDLELPDIERKRLRQIEIERLFRQKGFRRKGIRVRLDKKRTARSLASETQEGCAQAAPGSASHPAFSFPPGRSALPPHRHRHAHRIQCGRTLHHGYFRLHGYHEEVFGAELLFSIISISLHALSKR